jgi:hypothetical protein
VHKSWVHFIHWRLILARPQYFHDFKFCHKVDEKCTLLGYYVVISGNSLPTFWDDQRIGCPKTSVRNYHYSLHNSWGERSYHLSICYMSPFWHFEVACRFLGNMWTPALTDLYFLVYQSNHTFYNQTLATCYLSMVSAVLSPSSIFISI